MRGPLSDISLTTVLRRMKVAATAHGFRSTFWDGYPNIRTTPARLPRWRCRTQSATRSFMSATRFA